MLNIAYNALCDARCLQDLELRRQDEAYLNALGGQHSFPTPLTAGDFCRRFTQDHLDALQGGDRLRAAARSGPISPTCFSNKRFSTAMAQWSKPMASANREWTFPGKAEWGYHSAGDQFGR